MSSKCFFRYIIMKTRKKTLYIYKFIYNVFHHVFIIMYLKKCIIIYIIYNIIIYNVFFVFS